MSGPGRWSKRDKADSWGWERCRNNSRGNGRFEDDLYSSGRRNHHSPQRPRREEWRRLEMREHERQSGGFNNSLRSYRIEGSDFERYSNHEFGRNGSDHDRRPHRDENYGYGEFGRNRGGKYDSYNPRGGRGGNGENRPVVKMKERGASNACGSGSEHFGKRGRGGRGERGNRGNRGSRPQRTKEYFASDNVSEESVVKVRRCTDFSDNASSIKEHNEFEDIAGCCESSKGSIERHPPKDDTLELLENTTTSSGSNEIGVIEASKEVEKPTSSTNFESKNSDTESDCEKSRVDRKNYEEAPNDDPGSVMLAPKKEPATREGKKMVKLLTNFWEVKVESKIVYRYDVAVFLDTPTKEKAEDCLRGARDDSASVSRRKFCLAALRYALDVYRVLSQGAAVIHDGAGMMFSSEDLSAALKDLHGVMVLNVETLPKDLKCMIHRTDASAIHIELTPCRDAAASFDMADLSAQMNRNWAVLDRSWKQFYEILTSQDAVVSGRFTQFGAGCLYCASDRKDVGHGFERFYGAQKSIKFIEGRRRTPNCVVAALVLDHRLGLFFKSQSLMRSVREIRGLEEVERFDFSGKSNAKGSKQMNPKWNEVNDFVKGVRLNYICGDSSKPFTFVAIGISDIPIKDLKCFLPNKMKTEVSVLAKFSNTNTTINPYWPAVKWRGRDRKIEYFPMELLLVQPNQRVPLEKQLVLQSTPQADKPKDRFGKIHRLLEALNLHGGGARNSFLKAFGVSIGSAPKTVEGFRRDAPQIAFYGKENCSLDDNRYSWRQGRNSKFVKSAKVDRIDIIHDASCKGLYQTVVNALQKMFKSRGIQCGKFIPVPLDYSRRYELEQQLEQEFKQRSSMESILIIFIDDSKYKSHDYLKLLERKYLVPTQQLTTEIAEVLLRKSQSCENVVLKTNLKLGGFNYEVVPESFAQNVWIAKGKTLIVGYDVAHPGKATRDELMNKIPPKKPSVVGELSR
ncbi:hypothetical protein Q1695_010666 [Nippostrongylus brasiliensis]|nr:hypothetical protein Q1695_010666 [Nippostrongylus brasiliensis]